MSVMAEKYVLETSSIMAIKLEETPYSALKTFPAISGAKEAGISAVFK